MSEGTDPLARAIELLIEHQRMDIKGCLCGWAELGRCHARHVAGVLAAAGLLRDEPAETEYGIGAPIDGEMKYRKAPRALAQETVERMTLNGVADAHVGEREVGPWRPVEDSTEGKSDA